MPSLEHVLSQAFLEKLTDLCFCFCLRQYHFVPDGLELIISVPPPPESWGFRTVLPHPVMTFNAKGWLPRSGGQKRVQKEIRDGQTATATPRSIKGSLVSATNKPPWSSLGDTEEWKAQLFPLLQDRPVAGLGEAMVLELKGAEHDLITGHVTQLLRTSDFLSLP